MDYNPPAPLSSEISRQEYWSGLPFPSPEDLPDPRIKPRPPTLQVDSLLSEPSGNSQLHEPQGLLITDPITCFVDSRFPIKGGPNRPSLTLPTQLYFLLGGWPAVRFLFKDYLGQMNYLITQLPLLLYCLKTPLEAVPPAVSERGRCMSYRAQERRVQPSEACSRAGLGEHPVPSLQTAAH